MKTRKYNFNIFQIAVIFLLISVFACGNDKKKENLAESEMMQFESFFKISLAQWSLHKMVNDKGVSPFEFAKEAKSLGFEAVEYVSQLYQKQIETIGFEAVIDSIKKLGEINGIKCVLIMVDNEGDLADPDLKKRNEAVEKHKKWVDAAVKLGGHAIRVNTFGTNDPEVWKETVVDGLKKLSEYAASKNINVLCENHGWLSSDAPKLMDAIKTVNMANCGTLPDFGNWCVKRGQGERWGECIEEYPDIYLGVQLMMPAAKAVSAKSHDFDEHGNETKIDYIKMLQIVKDAGYSGFIGVEYEGSILSEREGILATKDLLLSASKQLN